MVAASVVLAAEDPVEAVLGVAAASPAVVDPSEEEEQAVGGKGRRIQISDI